MQRKNPFKKSISFLLAVLMVLQCGRFVMQRTAAATAAEGSGSVVLGNTSIAYTQKLTDNGNGTFTLELTLKDASSQSDTNKDSNVSRNGYFTAPASGKYLVEIWGGNGAPGSNTGGGEPGKGGSGGHIYGVVSLKKGETLFYQLGGNGQQTITEGEGGGVNGDGAGGGSVTTYTIGGGGGYSAVYKFAAGEFEDKYLDAEGNMTAENITEGDRTTKYILVAGGGGGGGASSLGTGGIFGLGLIGDKGNPPSGGAGGSMTSQSYTLGNGTVYYGSNGLTSGNNPDYIGKGGTEKPGEVSTMWLTNEWFSGSVANDWFATVDTTLQGGAGGSGNGRGGSGGAGYCGGSGGVQTEIIVATNVGGGGGGSSFVANEVDAPTEEQKEKLSGSHVSTTGGAIFITALDTAVSAELGSGVDLTLDPTDYFDISVSGAELSEGVWHTEVGVVGSTVTIVFTPKIGFAGGNNVPLLDGNAITCASSASDSTSTCSIPLAADCAAVNVQLNFEVDVVNHTTNDPDQVHPVSALHGTAYSDIAEDDWRYDFIQEISEYSVDHSHDGTYDAVTDTVSPDESTYYPVSITVTPTSGAAAVVGTPVTKTTFTKNAVIAILKGGTTTLNGNTINYNKTLGYKDGSYILSLSTSIFSNPTSATAVTRSYTTPGTGSFAADATGYYYIQVWGGDGGKGGDAKTPYGDDKDGGSGGNGAYFGQYVWLEKGDALSISVGAKGTLGNTADVNWGEWAIGTHGGGGGTTTVILTHNGSETPLFAAGGGGGGGGAWRYDTGKNWYDTKRGKGGLAGNSASSEATAGTYNAALESNAVAQPGTTPTDSQTSYWNNTNAPGGTAGISYLDSTILGKPNAETALTASTSGFSVANHTGSDGAVIITPLQLAPVASQTAIADYTVSAQLSQYFELTDISNCAASIVLYNDPDKTELFTDTVDLGYENGLITIGDIDPNVTTDEENVRSATFVIEIRLKPKVGFLGGNDVPILSNSSGIDNGMKMEYAQPDSEGEPAARYIEPDSATDYANVAIDGSILGSITPGTEYDGTANDRTIDQSIGENSVLRSNLYTWTGKPDLESYGWKADFVKLTETVTDPGGTPMTGALAPAVTTPYTVTVGLAPKEATPKFAVVVPAVEAVPASRDIEVIVLPQVHYMLTNMTASDELHSGSSYADGHTSIDPGVDHPITLTPASGYVLPNSIEVKDTNGKNITSEVGYNPSTGKLTIPARYAFGTITVKAAATPKTYSVTYYYYTTPSSTSFQTKAGGTYSAGQELNETLPTVTTTEGYTFAWDWGDGVTTKVGDPPPFTHMPGRNLIVIGTFTANKYDLTINYVYENGTQAAEPHTEKVSYLAAYQVTSPLIEGYLADKVSVSGTMSLGGETVTVTYKATDNQLNIYYLYADGSKAADPVNAIYATDAQYSVTSPAITGYTANQTVISGTMGAKGATYYVYYTPNTYTVTFDDGVNKTYRTVEYDNKYSYDVVANTYTALPTPAPRAGYNFTGWTDSEGHPITANDIVKTAVNHTLHAKWEAKQITVTIKYIDDAGNLLTFADATPNPLKVTGSYGTNYSVDSPSYIGNYTPNVATVSGTFTEDKVVTVVYTAPKTYTLSIYYLITGEDTPFQVHTLPGLLEGEAYSVTSPQKDGYTPTPAVVSGVMPDSDLVIKVFYTKNTVEKVISVTVEWGNMDFEYTHGQWDSGTHTYDPSEIDPATNLGNRIIVTNSTDSTIPVYAALAYKPATAYGDIQGYFTDANAKNGIQTYGWALVPGDSGTAYLWLEGELNRSLGSQTITSGECIVTITGGS